MLSIVGVVFSILICCLAAVLLGKEKLTVKVEDLKDEKLSAMITLSEESRRMQEMMRMYGMGDMAGDSQETLVLNANNALVKFVREHKDSPQVPTICRQLYDLARISHAPLSPEEMYHMGIAGGELVIDFAVGDTVKVTSGVWEDTVGVIQWINEGKQSVTILVDMFGRETPVELNFTEVRKM